MSTPSQILANRQNAQSSTGPSSDAGKLNSSRNATRHGLASAKFHFLAGEDPAEFDTLHQALVAQYTPANANETLLVHDLAKYRWLIDRAINIFGLTLEAARPDAPQCLSVMMRYQRNNEIALQKTVSTLANVQKTRREEEIGFVREEAARQAAEAVALQAQADAIDEAEAQQWLADQLKRGQDLRAQMIAESMARQEEWHGPKNAL